MIGFIVSDDARRADALRRALGRAGHNCPEDHTILPDQAAQALAARATQGIFLVVTVGKSPPATLRTIHQLRQTTNEVIIAVGPKEASVILEAIRAGADDYVDETLAMDELPHSISRHGATRGLAASEGELIVVMSGSGGSGRSLVATNLSVTLANIQGRCGLVELDACSGNCASLLNLKPRHTILDLCRRSEKLDRKTLEKALIEHDSGVSLLPAPSEPVRPDVIGDEFIERAVRELRTMFPKVVLDCQDGWNTGLLRRLSAQTPHFLVLTRLDFNSVCNTGRVLSHLEKSGIDRHRVQVLANRHGEPGNVPPAKIEHALATRVAHLIPDDPRTVHRSINTGVPFVVDSPAAPISKAVSSIAESFTGACRIVQKSQSVEKSPVAIVGRIPLRGLQGLRSIFSRRVSS